MIIKQSMASHSKAETIINESDIDDVLESMYTRILSKIQKFFRLDY